MKTIIITAITLILMQLPAQSQDWVLVWADEFEYVGPPDPEKWANEVGFIRNKELQYYTDGMMQNTRVESGMLILEARKGKIENQIYSADPAVQVKNWKKARSHADYTSASITTLGKASWLYGRIEVRAKLPTGNGIWPAIWMMGTNNREVGWPECGEIDIMENVGHDPDMIHGNAHVRNTENMKHARRGSYTKAEKPYESFHIYAIEWSSEKIDFFVNDTKYFTHRKDADSNLDWPFDKEQYLILNVAIGGSWAGKKGIDDSIFPQKMEIDYVRVYQLNTKPKRSFFGALWQELWFEW